MKKIAVFLVALGALFFSCKKGTDEKPVTPEPGKLRFWAVNLDSAQDYTLFGMYMDTVFLKPGEKTKAYQSTAKWWGAFNDQLVFEVNWAAQNAADTNFTFLSSENSAEICMMLIDKQQANFQIFKNTSPCFAPSGGGALIRAVDVRDYNTFLLINPVKNDTITVSAKTNPPAIDTSGVPCAIIKPGSYEVTATAPSLPQLNTSTVVFTEGKVYLLYAGYDNKVHVFEKE